ncbi:hpt domain-containing protein [Purpureocillium lilacinum]|uniref:Hpt domain-containing protein n=1 Tax=Purpureocillium lilacinum TaxID=33203 RepID=A0A179FEH1_PURLI|nr:hpt domain-containing protein [Purpureocillium lilacinum]OAQ63787.1 hpt domain-containing protein [Purpureocillium lilacinum]
MPNVIPVEPVSDTRTMGHEVQGHGRGATITVGRPRLEMRSQIGFLDEQSALDQDTISETLRLLLGDIVNINVFRQLLELDEPGQGDFSQAIIVEYIHQADEVVASMSQLRLSAHFLGGSSAALGLVRVQSACDTLQQCCNTEVSNGMDGENVVHSLRRCSEALELLKADYVEVQVRLRTVLHYLMQRDAVIVTLNQEKASLN